MSRKEDEGQPSMDPEQLLSRLSVTEKARLTTGEGFWSTASIDRVGIPSIILGDGPNGIRRQVEGDDHLGIGDSYPATCFPPAVALGASWDTELAEAYGVALGREARALGIDVLLAPGINIKRTPLFGRNFEFFSEDPRIAGELGAAVVSGIQSVGVSASLKHIAAYNQQIDQMRISVDVDERTLREIYLAGFERVVRSAHPHTVMTSYNRINGVYTSEDHWLLTDVLRDDWGFDGVVMSDWGAIDDRVAALVAGLDLEMPDSDAGPRKVVEALRIGRLSDTTLEEAAGRVLALVARHGQRRTFRQAAFELAPDLVERHHRLAREIAGRCIVLLKNDDALLPLDPSARVAVIGEFARTPVYQGAGSARVVPTRVDSALDEIERLSDRSVRFAPGYRVRPEMDAEAAGDGAALRAEAAAAASAADVAVVFLGLASGEESEGYDRTHIDLPDEQLALLRAVVAANPRVVVVLSNGAVVSLAEWEHQVPALIEGWLLGQAGGGALADVLFGVVNPSGRLAETIPLRLADTPAFGSYPGAFGHTNYGEGVFVGYRWYDHRQLDVAYPFGHGLSYSRFTYSDIQVDVNGSGDGTRIDVRLSVRNDSDVPGREIVQLYVEAPSRVVARPPRELRGFRPVALGAGECRTVSFVLDYRDLAYFHTGLHGWCAEGGTVAVHAGASSRDIRLTAMVDVDLPEVLLDLDRDSTIGEWLHHPRGRNLIRPLLDAAAEQGFYTDDALEMMRTMPLSRVARFPGFGLTESDVTRIVASASAERS